MFRDYVSPARRDEVFDGMVRRRSTWDRAFELRKVDMRHWVIKVPGWGTVYGIGGLAEAQAVVQLRPGRGGATIDPVESPDAALEWRNLAELLKELAG